MLVRLTAILLLLLPAAAAAGNSKSAPPTQALAATGSTALKKLRGDHLRVAPWTYIARPAANQPSAPRP
jgi:hypothetical protein